MKFHRTQLGIKIGSLADEARRIRRKEIQICNKAERKRDAIVGASKGFTQGSDMPEDLAAELDKRTTLPLKQCEGDLQKTFRTIDRIGRKAIRRYLRKGLSREEVLALPGMVQTFKSYPIYESLRTHRKGPVRHEARHAQLALAFLRERPYERCEDKASSYPNWDKVAEIAKRFTIEDIRIVMQRFEQWAQEATSFIRGRELMTKSQFNKEPLKAFG